MARVVLTTFGSAGDLNPFLAAGLGLRSRGHDVLFAVEDSFQPTVRETGFDVFHLAGDAATSLVPCANQMLVAAIRSPPSKRSSTTTFFLRSLKSQTTAGCLRRCRPPRILCLSYRRLYSS